MTISSSCVAVFSPKPKGQVSIFNTLENLLSLNYSTNNLSVLGRGSLQEEDDTIGIYTKSDQIYFKGEQGEFWRDLWDLLAGEAFLHIPIFGSLAVAGGLSSILLVENGTIIYPQEYTELSRALHRIGIPTESIYHYESLLKVGQLILIVNGHISDVEKACHLLENSQNSHEVSLHFVNTS